MPRTPPEPFRPRREDRAAGAWDPLDEYLFRTIDRDEDIVRITHAEVEHRSRERSDVLIPRFGPRNAAG